MSSKLFTLVRTITQVTCAMSGGDVVCQMLEKDGLSDPRTFFETGAWDSERTKRMGITGLCVQGPWTHLNYTVLEHYFAGTAMRAVLSKVACGALVAPLSISMTFSSIGWLQGKPMSAVQDKIVQDMPQTWATGACFWPAIMTLNFRFVPLSHRPLVGSLAGSFWSVYMAFQANKAAGTAALQLSASSEACPSAAPSEPPTAPSA
jgi:hypothetical protein